MEKINLALSSVFVPEAGDALSSIKSLLTWFFGAAGIALIIVGVIQLAESMAESNPSQRNRAFMMIVGGILIGGCAFLVNLITAPPGT
ncbi:MAG: hypothetical protein LBI43_06805 [Streptococcaceae bacterium]|jgi:hypothetical protein|nr:hypothetical protein [Streptococcaceae bacterium]